MRYDNIERTGDQTGTDDGVSLDSSLTKALKNGTIGLVFNTDVTTNDDGRRSFLRLNRNTVLPRAQQLSYSLGVTRSDGTGVDPLVSLNYTYNLPTSQISVGLNQTVVTDRNNDEEINTTLRASYSHDINNLSSLNATVSFFNRNELGEFANDGQRVNLSLSYRYALTRDWGLVSGYRYVLSRQDDRDDRDSNTVFIGLQRSFDWRP